MRKILYTFSLIAATLFALSCQSDWHDTGDNGGGNRPTDGDGFLLQLSVPGSSINTRMTIPSESGEDNVHTLHVLFFDAATNMFVDYMAFESPDLSSPIRVQFGNNPLLNHSDDYRLLLVANIGDYLPTGTEADVWAGSFGDASFASAQTEILNFGGITCPFGTNGTNQIRSDRLLMTATAERMSAAETDVITAELVRNVVRVDVELSDRVPNNFTLVSAEIWNVPNNTALWNDDLNNFDQLSIVANRPLQELAVPAANSRGFRGMLYTLPNRQNNISQNDRHTTAVIIGLNDGTETTFHRINISLPFAGQVLERNTVHNITVNHVLGAGAADADAAYNANRSMLQVSVNQNDMDAQGVILVDGQNILVLPTNRIVLPAEGGRHDNLRIFTYSPDGSARLTVSEIITPPGMNIVLRGNDLYVSADANVDARQGHIELRFGNITARIYVVQESNVVEFLYLNLGMTDIDRFANVGVFPNFDMTVAGEPGYVEVTSSGPWQARMFNEGFRFAYAAVDDITGTGTNQAFHSGVSGAHFRVAANSPNDANFVRYGFILVSLESNPNINQVLIVTQQGTDLVEVYYPMGTAIASPMTYFCAAGNVMDRGSQTRTFYLQHAPGITLSHSFVPTPESSVAAQEAHFAYVLEETAAPNTTRLTITAAGINPNLGNRVTGRIRITSPMGGEAHISIEQGRFNLSAIANPPPVGVEGGNTANITVAATQSIGAGPTLHTTDATGVSWTAELSANNNVWGGYMPSLSAPSGVIGTPFTVNFPRLPLMMIDTSPAETVTVSIEGITGGTQTVTVTQAQRVPRPLYILSGRPNSWGTWHASGGSASNRANFARLRQEIASTSNFGGPAAAMRAGARTFSAVRGSGGANRQLPNPNVDIFLANNTNHNPTQAGDIRAWLTGANNRVLIVTTEYGGTESNANAILGTWGFGFSGGSNTTERRVDGNANTSPIHNFLFRDGPFTNGTDDISGSVSMRPRDGVANPLTAAPTSAQIILRDAGGRMALAICPVNRVIAIPEPEIMGTGGRTNTNWNNSANVQFTQNLAAWIIGVATYGDEFIEHVNDLARRQGTVTMP